MTKDGDLSFDPDGQSRISRRRLVTGAIKVGGPLCLAYALGASATSARERHFVRSNSGSIDERRIHWIGSREHRRVALTFDDGPDPSFTPKVLAILNDHRVKATFFMLGVNGLGRPELASQVIAAGHAAENHGWNHAVMTHLSDKQVAKQISDTDEVLRSLGATPKYFRPPYGRIKQSQFAVVQRLGYDTVFWNQSLEGAIIKHDKRGAKEIVSRTKSGEVILAHDGGNVFDTANRAIVSRARTVRELPELLTGLTHRGFEFTTLDQLLVPN